MSTKNLWILLVTALFCASGCAVSTPEDIDDPYLEVEAIDPTEEVDVAHPNVYTQVHLDEPLSALSNEPEGEGEEDGGEEGVGTDGGDRNPDPTPWTGREEGEREDENPDPTPYSASISDTEEPDPQPWSHNH